MVEAAAPGTGLAADWDATWVKGVDKGTLWDVGGSHAVLRKLVADGRIPAGRALVPGCGRGYDVATLASPDRVAVGLEYSSTAAVVARGYLADEAKIPEDRWQILAGPEDGDFFKHKGAYDAIYDLTFLCALLPSRRGEWAAKMAELVKPGGVLVTLQYPLLPPPGRRADDFATGPPFLLTTALYDELLGEAFVKEDGAPVPAEQSEPRRAGAEAWALWRRR